MAHPVERRCRRLQALLLLLVGLLGAGGAAAQQLIVPLQLSFSDPGARSMGFGGAFVALADDATAAFANPAGLVQLLRPEVSVEGRHWNYSLPYTVGGRLEGEPSGILLDSTDGLRTAHSGDKVTGLSFLSLAYPYGDWSLAFYRHTLANYHFSAETQGFFYGGSDCCQFRDIDQRVATDVELVNYGLSVGYRLGDALSLGLTVVYLDATIDVDASQYYSDDNTLEGIFGPNSYLPQNEVVRQKSRIDSHDWTLNGGFLWRPVRGWTVGGVYRQAPEVDTTNELFAGPALDPEVPSGTLLFRASGIDIELPGSYGLGVAYRTEDGRLTGSLQWSRIKYSNVPDSLNLDDQTSDDADEWHAGVEYAFLETAPVVALRLGLWWEPDHQLRATNNADPRTRALLPRGDGQLHYAGGIGAAMENFQLDLGVDFADRVDTLSLSAIYSF